MDFNHPTPFSINFDTTSSSGALVCISILTIDDMALEGDHDFSISLSSSNLEEHVQLSTDSVTAVIKDNDGKLLDCQMCGFQHLIHVTSMVSRCSNSDSPLSCLNTGFDSNILCLVIPSYLYLT